MIDPSLNNINTAINWAKNWLEMVNSWALSINQPLVLEEFGLARDNWVNSTSLYSPNNPVTNRDRYFKEILNHLLYLRGEKGAFDGFGFWVYSGQARPGDEFIGDPSHEAPGWYSIYDKDDSTLDIMSEVKQKADEQGFSH